MTSRMTAALGAALLLAPCSAMASFHFMQIEQVIGGVHGDTDRQAVQLRMMAAGQTQLFNGEIIAYDANGENPVLLIEFSNSVPNGATGARVLVATEKYAGDPSVLPDFLMRPIPESYLNAGRLTFESHGGLIYWSLCWGGTDYTGSTLGSTTNDQDGDFGPCLDDPLATQSRQAEFFVGAATDLSVTNAGDYARTAGAAVFIANDGSSGIVTNVVVFADGFDR